jgi:hypothetical protein
MTSERPTPIVGLLLHHARLIHGVALRHAAAWLLVEGEPTHQPTRAPQARPGLLASLPPTHSADALSRRSWRVSREAG